MTEKQEHVFKEKSEKQELQRLLLPSVLGILLCVCCLLGSTLAWFSAANTVSVPTVSTATYEIEVTVKKEGLTLTPVNGTYQLPTGSYTLTLQAGGSASQGYCLLDFGDGKLRTDTILQGQTKHLTLTVDGGSALLKIMAQWGSPNPEISLVGDIFTYRVGLATP